MYQYWYQNMVLLEYSTNSTTSTILVSIGLHNMQYYYVLFKYMVLLWFYYQKIVILLEQGSNTRIWYYYQIIVHTYIYYVVLKYSTTTTRIQYYNQNIVQQLEYSQNNQNRVPLEYVLELIYEMVYVLNALARRSFLSLSLSIHFV